MIRAFHGVVVSAKGSFRGIVNQGLVLHYNTFNESSYKKGDGASILDISGSGLNGTITGAPSFNTNYFTFVNDYLTTANLNTTLTEVHSTEVWIYPTNNGVVMQANAQPAPDNQYHHSTIEIVAGKLEFGLWNGNSITSTGPTANIAFNAWHQVVLTYDGATVRGYLDGQLVGSVNVVWDSPEDDTGDFYYNFGSQDGTDQGDGTYFDGRFGIFRIYDYELSASQVAQNYNSVSDNVAQLATDQLVLYYDPSSAVTNVGGNSIYNIAPYTLTGTVTNLTDNGNFYSYNGTTSQISISDNVLLEPGGGNFTLEAWVRFNNFDTTSVIVGKFSPGGLAADISYALRAKTSGELRFEVGDGTGSLSSATYDGVVNTWYHLVGVIDNVNNVLQFYVNGVSQGNVVMNYASILNTATNLYIGSYNNGEYDQYVDGDIGTVRVYKKALSSTEALANYNFDKSKYQ